MIRDKRRDEAVRARKRAEQELEETRAETPRYRDLAARLRATRERNHFAESIAASFQGRAAP